MKIKKFKEFTYKSDLDDVLQDTHDIFDHLRDYDFDVKVETYKHQDESSKYPNGYIEEELSFRIIKSDKSTFNLEKDSEESIELKESLLRSKDIMSDWKFQMEIKYKKEHDVESRFTKLITKDVKLEGDNFVTTLPPFSSSKIDYPILVVRVFFTRQIGINI